MPLTSLASGGSRYYTSSTYKTLHMILYPRLDGGTMAEYKAGYIFENTDNLKISFLPNCDERGTIMAAKSAGDLSATTPWSTSQFSSLTKLRMPFHVHVSALSGRLEDFDVAEEINKLFTQRAREASRIVDHASFIECPGWYMFYPLLIHRLFREYYGIELECGESVEKKLDIPYFTDSHRRIIKTFTFNPNPKMMFCSCKTEFGRCDCMGPKNTLHADNIYLKRANQFVAEWGIPIYQQHDVTVTK